MAPPQSSEPRIVKVAIVGSGLAGLTAAYLLNEPIDTEDWSREKVHIEVHLFEKVRSGSLNN
jgi:microfibrillar-associated protein 1